MVAASANAPRKIRFSFIPVDSSLFALPLLPTVRGLRENMGHDPPKL
jgi:hypothetical protein